MLETEPNNQNETARGTENDGDTAPSGVAGTASLQHATAGDASTVIPAQVLAPRPVAATR
jgi:hypothetical protein